MITTLRAVTFGSNQNKNLQGRIGKSSTTSIELSFYFLRFFMESDETEKESKRWVTIIIAQGKHSTFLNKET